MKRITRKQIFGFLPATVVLILLCSCNGGSGGGSGGGGGGGTNPVTPLTPPKTTAYLPLSVTLSLTGAPNSPVTSVTVCPPGESTNCQTVGNILLDTGSTGLRVFASALPNYGSLPIESSAGSQIAECVQYADNSANWGPVALANVNLATGVTAESIPLQIINASYQGSSNCDGAAENATPGQFGYNGILGVGPFKNDSASGSAGVNYFSCTGGSCTLDDYPPESMQANNPVAWLESSAYNNGLTFKFPVVGANGGVNVIGYAILGVNTNSDNSATATNYYHTTSSNAPTFNTSNNFGSNSTLGLLDTGSNGLFFDYGNDYASLNPCGDWYCPSGSVQITVSNISTTGQVPVTLNIANANSLFNTSNTAFSNLGGVFNTYFDYGLPFFFGRGTTGIPAINLVFLGESAPNINLTGPYWAF